MWDRGIFCWTIQFIWCLRWLVYHRDVYRQSFLLSYHGVWPFCTHTPCDANERRRFYHGSKRRIFSGPKDSPLIFSSVFCLATLLMGTHLLSQSRNLRSHKNSLEFPQIIRRLKNSFSSYLWYGSIFQLLVIKIIIGLAINEAIKHVSFLLRATKLIWVAPLTSKHWLR